MPKVRARDLCPHLSKDFKWNWDTEPGVKGLEINGRVACNSKEKDM